MVNLQALNVAVIVSISTISTTLLVYFVKNKYFILIFPYIFSSLVTLFTYTVGRKIVALGLMLQEFIIGKQLSVLGSTFVTDVDFSGYTFYLTIMLIVITIMYILTANKYGKDYIA